MQLLSLLAAHHVLTSPQIAALLFASENVARKRLAKLTTRGVLARFRHCPGPGSIPWRYTLGPLGAMIVAADRDRRTIPTPSKTQERMLRISRSQKLDHLLGINEFFSRLGLHAQNNDGCVLGEWWNEPKTAEYCAGIVRPDAYGEWEENGVALEFFLEFDNGTEKMDDVTAKLERYRELSRAGMNIPILFVFVHPRRHSHFHRHLAEYPHLSAGLSVASATTADITERSPAGPVWHPATHSVPRRLTDLAQRPAARRTAA
ncbi:replication-relaxation family protein [Nocardia jiangxiensis]|uniref:Replication-relaxation family protein n=1 Tax=Nocardia jiangxiensis TaxID=282685 RepID=A0ABW6RZ81_9NOCA